jgi:error-prone DNA polymerase
VVPPDVNASVPGCSVEPGRVVRIGLGYVKGLSEDDATTIVAERAENGPYRSLADFIRRVPLSMEIAERLISVGAFDAFGLRRREALWQLGLFVTTRRVSKQITANAQAIPTKTPAIQAALPLPVTQDMVELTPMPAWDRMAAEYQVLGLSPHFHPLGLLRTRLPSGSITSQDIATIPDGTQLQMAGLVVCRQRPGTAKGVTFLLLEDEHGLVNVIVYPSLYQEYRLLVRAEPFLLVEGTMQRSDRNINIIATRFHRLAEVIGTLGDKDAKPEITLGPDEHGANGQSSTNPADVILEVLAPRSHSYR